MRAFAILDGGGVKGAALAGCLQAALEKGVHFEGYGGTSAGAIIAVLASIGYTGDEILEVLKVQAKPARLLDDEGEALRRVLALRDRLINIINSKSWNIVKAQRIKQLFKEAKPLATLMWKECGLYDGEQFIKIFRELIIKKLNGITIGKTITFADLRNASGSKPVKVVASNITGRCAEVYWEPNQSVIEAVRASMSYPFVFKPVQLTDGTLLSDGGLSSNLPTFLFAKDNIRMPILAFDLIATAEPFIDGSLPEYLKALLATALEASDAIFVKNIVGIHHIQINVPEGISAADFFINDDMIDKLYNAGQLGTRQFLDVFPQLKISQQAGNAIKRQLQATHGDPKLFLPVLWGLTKMIEERSSAKGVRASIMLPTGKTPNTRIVTYHHGYDKKDTDHDLELAEKAGCSGKAFKSRKPVIADLDDAKRSYEKWGMTYAQQGKIAKQQRSMMSVPIFAWSTPNDQDFSDMPVIGSLCIDSSTSLEQTDWLESGVDPNSPVLKAGVVQIMQTWADISGRMLLQ